MAQCDGLGRQQPLAAAGAQTQAKRQQTHHAPADSGAHECLPWTAGPSCVGPEAPRSKVTMPFFLRGDLVGCEVLVVKKALSRDDADLQDLRHLTPPSSCECTTHASKHKTCQGP